MMSFTEVQGTWFKLERGFREALDWRLRLPTGENMSAEHMAELRKRDDAVDEARRSLEKFIAHQRSLPVVERWGGYGEVDDDEAERRVEQMLQAALLRVT